MCTFQELLKILCKYLETIKTSPGIILKNYQESTAPSGIYPRENKHLGLTEKINYPLSAHELQNI